MSYIDAASPTPVAILTVSDLEKQFDEDPGALINILAKAR